MADGDQLSIIFEEQTCESRMNEIRFVLVMTKNFMISFSQYLTKAMNKNRIFKNSIKK